MKAMSHESASLDYLALLKLSKNTMLIVQTIYANQIIIISSELSIFIHRQKEKKRIFLQKFK